MHKICVVTASRAEYGLLRRLIEKIQQEPDLQLQLIVTGTHLDESFGYTVNEILEDGFVPAAYVPMEIGTHALQIVQSMSQCLSGIGKALEKLAPDIVVLLGDRYELLPIASGCLIFGIPIAHISGGETTEGAYDEYVRHAVSKLSFLHFTSTEEYRQRVIQLGEHPNRVFNVGDLGVENIQSLNFISKQELENFLQMPISDKMLLITFHPVTLENDSVQQMRQLLLALSARPEFQMIFTLPNADNENLAMREEVFSFAANNAERTRVYSSLGARKYLSLMKYCCGVVGNSSSGIMEAPSLCIGTINIGNRQRGRIRAESVIDCQPIVAEILRALDILMTQYKQDGYKDITNPYESNDSSGKIVCEIKKFVGADKSLVKQFYDLTIK